MGNEITVRGCNGIFCEKVHGRAYLRCFLPHRREVVPGESTLPKQEANSFLNHPAFQHVGVKPSQDSFRQRRATIEIFPLALIIG